MTLRFVSRNLQKRPFLNLIKVAGLSLALSSMLLIVLFLRSELTFDSFHAKSERIYRFTTTNPSFLGGKHFARLHSPGYIPEMAESFSGIENYVRLFPLRGGVMKFDEEFVSVNQAFECDSTFFEVFDAKLLVGNPENILDGPGLMVITESFAKRVFGTDNPIGQVLTLPIGQFNGEDTDYSVAGIMQDFPKNSHFHPDLIASPVDKSIFEGWAWTYFLLHKNANPEPITAGFKDFITTYYDADSDGFEGEAYLQKIQLKL